VSKIGASNATKEEESDAVHSARFQHEEVTEDATAVRDNSVVEEHTLVSHDPFLSDVAIGTHGETVESWPEVAPHARGNIFTVLQARVAAHRADIILALAVVVAGAALLWPTGGESGPKMAPWERVLIAMGIAEAPRPVVHYYGDPNLKVWVDTHTALYYCPGDELYGKSPDGHYTTQRAAQADQFEPAERSVCIE
jgi:hypothetical protein